MMKEMSIELNSAELLKAVGTYLIDNQIVSREEFTHIRLVSISQNFEKIKFVVYKKIEVKEGGTEPPEHEHSGVLSRMLRVVEGEKEVKAEDKPV